MFSWIFFIIINRVRIRTLVKRPTHIPFCLSYVLSHKMWLPWLLFSFFVCFVLFSVSFFFLLPMSGNNNKVLRAHCMRLHATRNKLVRWTDPNRPGSFGTRSQRTDNPGHRSADWSTSRAGNGCFHKHSGSHLGVMTFTNFHGGIGVLFNYDQETLLSNRKKNNLLRMWFFFFQ